ncbi:MAG: hypothetical protein ABIH92_02890 [Nanoarchaeota archaeon]
MKIVPVTLIIGVLLFSLFLITNVEADTPAMEQPNATLTPWPWCCNIIKDIKILLTSISERLDGVFDVNVISQPEAECGWETYSHVADVGIEGYATKYIPVPDGVVAGEINVTRAFAYFKWSASSSDQCTLLINDVICLRKGGNSGQNYYLYPLEEDCLYAFTPGLNEVRTSYIGGCFSEQLGVGELMVEMQIKPSNC